MTFARSTFPFRSIHVVALALCLGSLPWSTAFLSMAQMLLAANWLAEGIVQRTIAQRFRAVFTSAPTLVFLSFLLLHIVGLLWTDDLEWGLDLCRILFPILVFGVILSGSERLGAKELRVVLLFGAWNAIIAALSGLIFSKHADTDYRSIAMFISHIRLALLLCLAVVLMLYYRSQRLWVNAVQWYGSLLALYLINRLGSVQGFVILGLIALVMLWRRSAEWSAAKRKLVRVSLIALPMVSLASAVWLIEKRHQPMPVGFGSKTEYTAGGESYYHDTTNTQMENGTYVWTYLAWGELRRAWLLRSDRTLDDADDKGHPLWATAVRYLASKGLHKDSVAVMSLGEGDIHAIERGQANALHDRGTIRERVEEVLLEIELYRNKGSASGHSVTMRVEFQKAGLTIATANCWSGVGTGDTQRAFNAHYTDTHSTLDKKWWLRAHNEYLTLWISFGVFGLLWSLFAWWWPAHAHNAWKHPLFLAWAIAFAVSCFTDDTIETQAGATFFALYYALFVFAAPKGPTLPTASTHASGVYA